MLGMKNHFDISYSIEIHEVDIAGVACISLCSRYIRCAKSGYLGKLQLK